jgi:hypothetical protein
MRKCKHPWTVSIYDEATGQEFSRQCSGCGEQMSLGPDTPVIYPGGANAYIDFSAALLISEIANGEVRMTNAESDGYHGSNSPFAGSGAWHAGWLARAWVDHDELQRQEPVSTMTRADHEAAFDRLVEDAESTMTADKAYALGLADGTDGRTSRSEMVDRPDDDPLCIAYARGYVDGSRARLVEDGAP